MVVLFSALIGFSTFAMATEEPAYTVAKELAPGIELRDYAPMLIAEVEVRTNDFSEAGSAGFKPLAGYIFGNNSRRDRIGMTAPVQQSAEGERIGMTAPVGRTQSEEGWLVSFVMPARYTKETLPEPRDPSIRVREIPARSVAVIRFSGRWSTESFEEQQALLLDTLLEAKIQTKGAPWSAQYNPPWTPGFMRRNEILVEIERPD